MVAELRILLEPANLKQCDGLRSKVLVSGAHRDGYGQRTEHWRADVQCRTRPVLRLRDSNAIRIDPKTVIAFGVMLGVLVQLLTFVS